MKNIYLDYAAATPVGRPALDAMNRAARLEGNPSSAHAAGRRAAELLRRSRVVTAAFLNVRPSEIVYTASASEANTMAIIRLAEANPRYRHIVTNPAEHMSVLKAADTLRRRGWKVTMVPVDREGRVDPGQVISAVRRDTLVVSVMYANNEIGTIQPVAAIGKALRRVREGRMFPLLHTDACQAAAYLDMDVRRLQVDLLTMNGSKVYGPRGIGVLYVSPGILMAPQIVGSSHERGLRAGTENVPAIAGIAAALRDIRPEHGRRIARLRDWAMKRIMGAVPGVRINGPLGKGRVPGNISFSVPGVPAEPLVLELDRRGLLVGAGAACTIKETGHSHVMRAIGVPRRYRDAIRVSVGRSTTRRDMERFLTVLPQAVSVVRKRYRI